MQPSAFIDVQSSIKLERQAEPQAALRRDLTAALQELE